MKKVTKVISLVLIVAALLTFACGCNSEHINKNPSDQTTESSSVGENGNTYTESVDTSKLTFAKTCDNVDFYHDENNQWYAYIDRWGTYRKLGNIQGEIYDALLGENTVDILTGNVDGKLGELTVTNMKLSRQSPQIEFNANDFDVLCSELNIYFFNYYDKDCAYFFYMPEFDHGNYPLLKYATFDSGKTWVNQGYEPNVSGLTLYSFPIITKFITKEVGIVSYRCAADEGNLCSRTWLTSDCGKTWFRISQLPFPFEFTVYRGTDVINFEIVDGRYLLSVAVFDGKEHIDQTLKFISDDLCSWTLVE